MSQDQTTMTSAVQAAPEAKIEILQMGAAMQISLNRARALNAFDADMCAIINRDIPTIARNPDIYIVVLRSNSPKAFCAGGDIKALTTRAREDLAAACTYFAEEYKMNWLLECFSKPTVSLIDGICMGSGAGLTCYNTHRVAGEGYLWAMPETAIGLFPDVGVAHVLARMPWPMGLYLGLTGARVLRSDAYWLKLVTHCIDAAAFPEIVAQLGDSQPVDPLLDEMHQTLAPGPLQQNFAIIEKFFSAGNLNAIIAHLQTAADGAGEHAGWAGDTLQTLRQMSPLSLALTDRHIRNARDLDLRSVLIADFRLAVRCLADHDFYEGVRAALIDKDGAPQWSPGTLGEVTEEKVAGYFAPLERDDVALELDLPSRAEMQSARV